MRALPIRRLLAIVPLQLVVWLALAVAAIPDLYYGALTDPGTDPSLFRNLLARARHEGLVVEAGRPADGRSRRTAAVE